MFFRVWCFAGGDAAVAGLSTTPITEPPMQANKKPEEKENLDFTTAPPRRGARKYKSMLRAICVVHGASARNSGRSGEPG